MLTKPTDEQMLRDLHAEHSAGNPDPDTFAEFSDGIMSSIDREIEFERSGNATRLRTEWDRRRVNLNAACPVITPAEAALCAEKATARQSGASPAVIKGIKIKMRAVLFPPIISNHAPVKPGFENEAMKAATWPVLITASDLCAVPPPPIDVLVDGLLVKLGLSIFSGASKSRKTWTALDLALSVSSGADWLGRNTVQGPVVYLNFELSQDTMHRRLHSICEARGLSAPDELFLWNLRGHFVTATNLRANLVRQCAAIRPSLVILDPFYKVAANSGAEENSNDGQARLLSDLEVMARECNAALFMLHHYAKGNASEKNAIDRGAGAGALARAPDAVLTLTEHETPEVMVLEAALRDFPPMAPTALRWVHPCWQLDDTADPAKLKKAGRKAEHTASELLPKLTDGMTSAEWEKASTWKNSTFRRIRDKLIESGKVTVTMACYYHAKS